MKIRTLLIILVVIALGVGAYFLLQSSGVEISGSVINGLE